MRLLILGGNGQLGRELTVALSPLGEVVVATRNGRSPSGQTALAADLERPERLAELLREVGPDVIVNAAAYTAVDRAEEEPDRAHRVNAEAPAALAVEAARAGTLLIHYSTDYVFGTPEVASGPVPDAGGRGKEPMPEAPPTPPTRPWQETDPTHPLNVYGKSKLHGEQSIRASACPHLILRTSWLYAAHGHNFLRTMLRLAGERDELRIVDDQTGSPTWARTVAIATATILARLPAGTPPGEALAERTGTYHLAATGGTTWREYAAALFQIAHEQGLLPRVPTVAGISTAEFGAPAARPPYSVLDCTLAEQTFGVRLPEWRQSLADCLADLAASGI